MLGPGLVTGSSDDNPSGIAAYSQVGGQFGYAMLRTMVLSYQLIAPIQAVSARIGRVTGAGIDAGRHEDLAGPVVIVYRDIKSSQAKLHARGVPPPA